ncbi:nuclear transport factor 2 family protein [Pedobacter sp. ISL-68]|uniref:nuclear transport factor 2 family protein n=1 Tax=unclassified Pedobacter TaxID=2628915 RepID=UPI001BEC3320|nr:MULTISPECIES: nuclear transport factor 2 family protein [unclassified Pedobacter]MBT2563817.1 nuclear transport factor 2 family protein [Pedobacter sp. ISL-64]MBT2592777.1 nuclear transport factor 2 family protein [Pedobacter sp. ISL-68]
MMENQSKETVIEFLTSVKAVDLEKIGQLLSSDVNWSQPGSNEISGLKRSQQEVFGMVGKMFEISGNTLQLDAYQSISLNGNRVACLLHWMAEKPSGEKLDVYNIDIYTVEHGKICNVEIFSADQVQEDDFWTN